MREIDCGENMYGKRKKEGSELLLRTVGVEHQHRAISNGKQCKSLATAGGPVQSGSKEMRRKRLTTFFCCG